MAKAIRSITDVAEKHLCCGCGACAYVQPEAIRMVDDLDQGRRPLVREGASTAEALGVCPGLGLELAIPEEDAGKCLPGLRDHWGPVLEVWEGYAGDGEIRFAGSSGGAATALALHCLEREGMHGVVHIAARPDVPYLNRTVLSTTRAEMLAATGSRYAPASPCDGLQAAVDAPRPCVFIGKPCDVAATRMARARRPELDRKLGLTIAIFCAGAPSTAGTLEMARVLGVEDPRAIRRVRYRGNGWPGAAEVATGPAVPEVPAGNGGEEAVRRLGYEESWGAILQKHRPWRCHVCADHSGEFADVSVGDPWYREIPPGEPGRSFVMARTERGRRLVRAAIESGALVLEPADPGIVSASQPNLLRTRGAVWARILTTRLLGIAAPRFVNMPMLGAFWRYLGPVEKVRAFTGTLKRAFTKGLFRRRKVREYAP